MIRFTLYEAFLSVIGRLSRSILTSSGVAIGVGAVVAIIGISTCSTLAIQEVFDNARPTRLELVGPETLRAFSHSISDADIQRLGAVDGVENVGLIVTSGDQQVSVNTSPTGPAQSLPLVAVDYDGLAAEDARITNGDMWSATSLHRGDRVGLLGQGAALRLGIASHRFPSLIKINGLSWLILGIVDSSDPNSRVPDSVVVPSRSLRSTSLETTLTSPVVVVRASANKINAIAGESPVVLDPTEPDLFDAAVPPSATVLQRAVSRQTRSQLIAFSAIAIFIGAIGIGNTTLMNVVERRKEIGIRRAIGASRLAILLQFLSESAMLGAGGGLAGAVLGEIATGSAAILNGWPYSLPAILLIAGPTGGLVVGLLSGLYPALRAAQVPPVEALRS